MDGNVCADGSPTGFAYNLKANATELLIFFIGGGACWNTDGCFTHISSVNLKGYGNATFQAKDRLSFENQLIFTSRNPAAKNPWAKSSFVFVLYCTGDFHAGNAVTTYAGAPAPIHHKGHQNFQNILKFLADAVPNMSDVWVTGVSAAATVPR